MQSYENTERHQDENWEKTLSWQLEKLELLLKNTKEREDKIKILEKMCEIYSTLKIEGSELYSKEEHSYFEKKLKRYSSVIRREKFGQKEQIATERLEDIRKQKEQEFYQRLYVDFKNTNEFKDGEDFKKEELEKESKEEENYIDEVE